MFCVLAPPWIPYDFLGDREMRKELVGVIRTDASATWEGVTVRGSTAGLRLVNFFHPIMWAVRCRDAYAPLQRFESDLSLRRVLRHALTIWPERFSVNATNLRSMLRTFSKTTRVSNFRPTLAKAIIERFSKPGQRVLDFSAGYGGRLLGCIACLEALLRDRSKVRPDPRRDCPRERPASSRASCPLG